MCPKKGIVLLHPVLCVELAAGVAAGQFARIEAELRALGAAHAHTAPVATFLLHPGFPVDIRHNAKIGREKLAAWAATAASLTHSAGART